MNGSRDDVERWTRGGECEAVREILSADLDGRADAPEIARARHHVSTCRVCREWLATAESLQRAIRVRPAEFVPDLSAAVLERAHPPRPGRGEWIRYALVVVALTQFVVALPHLFSIGALHDSRHLGAMAVALSLGLLYTAHRPTRAYGILPIVSALAVTMVGAALVDVIRGSTPLIGEAVHVLELTGFVLVWMLAGRPGLPRRRRPVRRRVLRTVESPEASSRRSVA